MRNRQLYRLLSTGILLALTASSIAQTANTSPDTPSSDVSNSKASPSAATYSSSKSSSIGTSLISSEGVSDPKSAVLETDQGGPVAVADPMAIRELRGAGLLRSTSEQPYHFGPISVRDIEFNQIFDQLVSGNRAGSIADQNMQSSVLRTDVSVEKRFRRSRFALQYQPRLWIVDGKVQNDYSNQNASFDTQFMLAPRWQLGLSDQFSYVGSQSLIGENYLNFDSATGGITQNQFLEGTLDYLSNTAAVSLTHQFSAATSIVISPSYSYEDSTTSSTTSTTNSFSNRMIQFQTRVSHSIRAGTQIGAFYGLQLLQTVQTSSGVGTVYHNVGVNVQHQFTPRLTLKADIGAASAGFATGQYWTGMGTISLAKQLRRSALVATYSRGLQFGGYATNNSFGDRVDALFHLPITRRFSTDYSGDYFRGASINGRKIDAKYATAGISYSLARHLSATFSYVNKWQKGDGSDMFDGTRRLFLMGLRWDASPTQSY
jgi:hypothetical protein